MLVSFLPNFLADTKIVFGRIFKASLKKSRKKSYQQSFHKNKSKYRCTNKINDKTWFLYR